MESRPTTIAPPEPAVSHVTRQISLIAIRLDRGMTAHLHPASKQASASELADRTPDLLTAFADREFASRSEPSKKPSDAELLTWLGRQYVNGTFTDEDFQNVDDVEEIQKLLDDTAEDESCSE